MPNQTLRRSSPSQTGGTPATSGTNGGAKTSAPQAMLPFGIGARTSSRFSFTLPTTTLGAAPVALSPVQIPAVGYLKKITLEVTLTGSGGTTPAFTADAPFNLLSLVELRNSSGNDLLVPMDGYRYFLLNKYGCQGTDAPECDPKADQQYSAASPNAHFFLDIPCEIAPADQFGSIPALASNRSYQLAINLAAQAVVTTSNPTLTVAITGTAWFYTEPVASTMNGIAQQTSPPFNGSLNLWQYEPISVTPGDKYIRSNNVGNVLRCLIFTLRTAAGARTDVDWPALAELYLDNNPMFYLPVNLWQSWMSRTYGFQRAAAKDGVGTLDTGVYVIPFFALAEGSAIANARRSQYLPTLDASQLQLRGTSWGPASATLEVITNSVQPSNPQNGNSASALYALS